MKTVFGLMSAAVLGLLATSANAQYDESRIRQADQQTQVTSYGGSPFIFTISGYPNDYIFTPFYCGPLGGAPFVTNVIPNSGGQCSFRFCVPCNPGWNGTTIDLYRPSWGWAFIDGDRVRTF